MSPKSKFNLATPNGAPKRKCAYCRKDGIESMHSAELSLYDLTPYADAIRHASQPCLTGQVSDTMGNSYFGGVPLVPHDFRWPEKCCYPLAFIGQIHCADVDFISTDNGDLLFFYDNRHWGHGLRDLGHAVVVHVLAEEPRVPAELPAREVSTFFGLRKKIVQPKVYQRVDVSLTPSTSYPSLDRKLVPLVGDVAEECYMEFRDAIRSDIQMGGYPSPVQDDRMERDCVRAFRLGEPKEWVLLLQLFEIGDMKWGDAGCLYWFIHQDDLAQNRFDRVWMVAQCH